MAYQDVRLTLGVTAVRKSTSKVITPSVVASVTSRRSVAQKVLTRASATLRVVSEAI